MTSATIKCTLVFKLSAQHFLLDFNQISNFSTGPHYHIEP